MDKKINVKLIHNKKNGQFNISIPKRKFSKKDMLGLKGKKSIKITIEGLS